MLYIWYAFFLISQKAEAIVNENTASWAFFTVVFFAFHTVLYADRNIGVFVYQLWVFCFAAAIVIFTMRWVVDNPFLRWVGEHLFELYILQRLPMMILKPYMLTEEADIMVRYCYVVICFLSTVIISVLYRKTIVRLAGMILTELERKEPSS